MKTCGWWVAVAAGLLVASHALADEPKSLRGRLGQQLASEWMASDSRADRLRGLERLGTLGTPQAIQALVDVIDAADSPGSAEERLVAIRALSHYPESAEARRSLVRVLTGLGTGGAEGAQSPLATLAHQSAGLALAEFGDAASLDALGKSLRAAGAAAEVAREALVAHPPELLRGVLAAPGAPSVELVEALARLGDQRAFHPLRALIRRGSPEVRAAAAVALTRLGASETVALARHWLAHERSHELRAAATRILVLSRAEEAPAAVSRLLRSSATRRLALELACTAPYPALTAPLTRALEAADTTEANDVLECLGRVRNERAVDALITATKHPSQAAVAWAALGRSRTDRARSFVEAALEQNGTRRWAARAALIRARSLGEDARALTTVLGQLLQSEVPADRAVGALGIATMQPKRLPALLGSRDPVVMRAAAQALRSAEASAVRIAVKGLREGRATPTTRTALSTVLLNPKGRAQVPTRALLELIELAGPSAALATCALAERAPLPDGRLEGLLTSGDPWLREHAARGLGANPNANATGILTRVYRFETDPHVRLAIVLALSQRSEATRERALRLASRLDPAPNVRSAARLALGNTVLTPKPSGTQALLLELRAPSGGPPAAPATLGVVPRPGLAHPIVADPDGIVLVLDLPDGPVDVRLAASPKGDQSAR